MSLCSKKTGSTSCSPSYEDTNHLVDEGFSTIGNPDIAHPKFIGRSMFSRLDPNLKAGICRVDCSRFYAYVFRFNAFGACFAFPNKYGLTLDEVDVRGLRGCQYQVPEPSCVSNDERRDARKDGQNEPNPQTSLCFLKLYFVAPANCRCGDQHTSPAKCEPNIGVPIDGREAGIWSCYVPLQCVVTCDLEVFCVVRVRHSHWVG